MERQRNGALRTAAILAALLVPGGFLLLLAATLLRNAIRSRRDARACAAPSAGDLAPAAAR